jgi:hypothetical protein
METHDDQSALERRILHDMIMLQSSLGIHDRPVTDINHCTSSFFVHLADKYFGILSEITKPDSHESKVYNISVIIRHLESALAVSLSHIDPDAVARQNLRHVSYLLDVFVCLIEPPPSQTIEEWQSHVIPPQSAAASMRPVSREAIAQFDVKLAALERAVDGLEKGRRLPKPRESPALAQVRRRVTRFLQSEEDDWRRLLVKHAATREVEDAKGLREFIARERRELAEMRNAALAAEREAMEQRKRENEALRLMYDTALTDLDRSRDQFQKNLLAASRERKREHQRQRREIQAQYEEERRAHAAIQRSLQERKFFLSQ